MIRFNPFTGTFDFVGSGFDENTILTASFLVLMDEFGNVLVGA